MRLTSWTKILILFLLLLWPFRRNYLDVVWCTVKIDPRDKRSIWSEKYVERIRQRRRVSALLPPIFSFAFLRSYKVHVVPWKRMAAHTEDTGSELRCLTWSLLRNDTPLCHRWFLFGSMQPSSSFRRDVKTRSQ